MANKYFTNRTIGLLLLVLSVKAYAQMRTDTFRFSFDGRKYTGLIDIPTQTPKSMIIIVPGSGKTNVVANNDFHGLRSRFAAQGITCLIWDKAGCGKSEGIFDYNQTVQNSASEVIAAITEAKAEHMPGSEQIGLWGISRAGWICPLVIEQTPISFWISVSGTDAEENFGYLLEKNFVIEGRSEAQAKMLVGEWLKGTEIARTGGSFEENLVATEDIRRDSFYMYLNNYKEPTKEGFEQWKKEIKTGKVIIDSVTDLVVYVPGFDTVLSKINCPVLALFGEKDMNVDWQKTMALYKRTIGKNPGSGLMIKVFPDCDHGMLQCKTGGIREDLTNAKTCPGYYDTMKLWLKEKGFGN